ncbi:MAG: helix-turn-helix transcriptional regulator [Gemmatimonadota bacterium]
MPTHLGEFEQLVLLAVLRLGGDAYGVRIGDEIETVAQRRPSSGALYTTLDRLEGKGLLVSAQEADTGGRAGRPRRYYRLAPDGLEALRRSRQALLRMWSGHTVLLDRP